MSTEPQLFRVNSDDQEIGEVEFADMNLRERDIQEWVLANPQILGEDLLIIQEEFSDFDRTNERLDLLAVDPDGKLVIIELKRDRSGVDVHWQAIKYASYLRRATPQQVVSLLAAHKNISPSDAAERLREHTASETLDNLNSNQRIILVSHRFAREVTSAALWLNDKAQDENLITCVQLIPYRDGGVLYVLANTIIPVVGAERYLISIGDTGNARTDNRTSSSAGIKAARRRARNQDDEITQFCKKVETQTLDMLQDTLRTDSEYGYARGSNYRWYLMWYVGRLPWKQYSFNYEINVNSALDGTFDVSNHLKIQTRYLKNSLSYHDTVINELRSLIGACDEYELPNSRSSIRPRHHVKNGVTDFDDALVEETASSMKQMIETFTPKIEEFMSSHTADE